MSEVTMADGLREGRDELWKLEFVLDADLSHDGTTVAYTSLDTADDDAVHLSIVVVDVAAVAPAARRQLPVPGNPTSPAWAPDGQSLAVVAEVEGTRQVVLVDPDDGTLRVLTSLEFGVRGRLSWSPDGTRLAVAAARGRRSELDQPYLVERVPWRLDGLGEVGDLLCDILTIEAESGKVTAMSDGPTIDVDPRWSPDGRSILFVRSHHADDLGPMERHVVVDSDGERDLDWCGGMVAGGAFVDDQRVASICYRQSDRHRGSSVDLYVSDIEGGVSDNRTAGRDLQIGGAILADMPTALTEPQRWVGVDDGGALVPVLVGGSLHVARVGLDGDQQVETILDGERGCNPLAIRGGRLLYATSTATSIPDLVVRDLPSGDEQQVTHLDAASDRVRLTIEALEVSSADGTRVDAWYVHPIRGEGPHPTVLLIHGGPFAAYGHAMTLNAQNLARSGFGVVMSNPRGSLGYGTAFGTATRGAWGTHDYDDLMAVVDAAVAAGLADPDRLGVCGNSYGGYMTSWIVGHTNRFGAAVAQNPVVDFRSFRGTSDIGITFTDDVVAGSPVEVPDRYVERSPIAYAHRCTTPTRVVVSEADRRVPPFQGEMLHSLLCEVGCPTDMVRLPNASHAGSTFGPAVIRRAEDDAIVDWMQRHLGR
ncbi:MAG: S9 family peptidase [Actinomycetota bacterium]